LTQSQNKEKTHETGVRRISSLVDAWWKILLIFIGLIGMIYSAIVGWIKIENAVSDNQTNKQDIQFIKEHYATKDETRGINDKIEEIHSDMNKQTDIETKQIEEALDWIEFEKGRQQGLKESKK